MGTSDAEHRGARAALPPGLRPSLDTLRSTDPDGPFAKGTSEEEAPGLKRLREHLADYEPNTRRAYLSDWRSWVHWCSTNDRAPLPAHPADIALYLVHAQETQGATAATLQRRASTIATTHIATGHPDPTRTSPASDVLRWSRGVRPRAKRRTSRWLTDAEFTRVLATTHFTGWPEAVIAHRDRLILLLARATGEGPEAILALRTGELGLHDGHTTFTDTNGEQRHLEEPLSSRSPGMCLTCSLVRWRHIIDTADTADVAQVRELLDQRPQREGHLPHDLDAPPNPDAWLLRRVRKGGNVTPDRMSAKTLRDLLRSRATTAGVDTTGLTAFALRPHP